MTDKKVIVIGLDGATWDLMKPWVEAGMLPTFKKLMENGVHGNLETAYGRGRFGFKSIQSGTAWVSFVTGKKANKHGIHGFTDKNGKVVKSTSIKGKKIWNFLSDNGYRVGIVNIPVTYPPDKVNGFMITSFLTPPNASDYTYPMNLKHELSSDFRLSIHSPKYRDQRPSIDFNAFMEDIYDINEKRTQAVLMLLKNKSWDFFAVNFKEVDEVQHFCWHFVDKDHPQYDPKLKERYGNLILEFYQYMENVINEIINSIKEPANIFIISDHGLGSKFKGYDFIRKILLFRLKILGRLKQDNLVATHTPYGIFLAFGPDLKTGEKLKGLRLIDLAPTILHIFGTPIPKDMDGRVLKEIFKEDSEPAKREVEYQGDVDEKELVKEKIKKLKVAGKL